MKHSISNTNKTAEGFTMTNSEAKANNDKCYIGKVEAYELLQELFFNDFQTLPRKGKEYVNVPAIASGKDITYLGKDSEGYYVKTESQAIN